VRVPWTHSLARRACIPTLANGPLTSRTMLEIRPALDYLIGIDSDGCVFDSMELKHKECFIPCFIDAFGLQGVSRYAREAAEFVNLYSKSRGCNRFLALVEQLDWLGQRPEVRQRGVMVPRLSGLEAWIARESKLGNPALEKTVAENGTTELKQILAWSRAVNESIAQMVRDVPPFPSVRGCLERLSQRADLAVVSASPTAALTAEWREHHLDKFVQVIGGQEHGTKGEMLAAAAKYPQDHVLMIGDAPGDHRAAMANGCLFYPINPGAEEASWRRLLDEGIDRFLAGTFAGEYQVQLLAEFNEFLPELPPWPVVED